MAPTTSTALRTAKSYRIRPVPIEQLGSETLLREWRAFLERNPADSPIQDPESLIHSASDGSALRLYFLYCGDQLCGVAPLVQKAWPLACQLGEITVAKLPLQRLCLLGSAHFPGHPDGYELLFREILDSAGTFDAIYIEDLPSESDLARYLEARGDLRRKLRLYTPEPPAPRLLLKLEGTFDEYMSRFSPKHRQTLRRKLRKFDETAPGKTRYVCVTRPEEVDSFIEQAAAISQKTYQWQLLGQGLRHTERIRQRLRFFAEQGWLRSYLLLSGDTPCAFLTGYQYGERFFLDDMGYDPEWREHSPGTVLQLRLIEHLFSTADVRFYDLGEYGAHKAELASDEVLQAKVMLFRPGLYRTAARLCHATCVRSSAFAAAALERIGLKKRIKKLIRTFSRSA